MATAKQITALTFLAIVLHGCHAFAASPVPESVMLASPDTYPHGITSDGNNLWTTDYANKMIYCIDPADGAEVDAFTTTNLTQSSNRSPRGCAWDGETLWIATKYDLWQVDVSRTTRLDRINLSTNVALQGLAHDGTNLWVVDTNSIRLLCIDPVSGNTNAQLASPASSPRGVEVHAGNLWHVDSYQDRVYAMDPATGNVASSFLVSRSGPRGITWHDDRFWLIDRNSDPQPSIIGITKSDNAAQTRTTAYVSRGTVTSSFTNTTDATFTNTYVATALGTSDNATAILSRRFRIDGIVTTPTGLSTDAFGQVCADLYVGNMVPGTTAVVEIEYIARLHNWIVNVDTNLVGNLADIDTAIINLYTRDEEMYNITHQDIASHAVAAVGAATNVFTVAHLVHDHVIEHLSYDSNSTWKEAVAVLSNGVASCTGYAFTMIALCRNRGIPARFVGGSECRSFEIGRIDTLHHRWVEVYVPNYGWVPFDPTHDEPYPAGSARRRWREVGAQQRALVLRRGGGPNKIGWGYTTLARHDGGYVDAERSVVWEGLPWDDGADFDDDAIANINDDFAYDYAASLDTDGDGLPDDWNSGASAEDSTSVPPLILDRNNDNDPMTDREEAIAGSDPANADSVWAIQNLSTTTTNLQIEWPSVSGRVYAVWSSTTVDGAPICDGSNIVATPDVNTFAVDAPATSRFYRVYVTMDD